VSEWRFDDPPNLAVLTLRQIARDGHPILFVVHDEGEGGWQFLPGDAISVDDAMLVSLQEILDRDATIHELADLPVGWQAWRQAPWAAWVREPRGRGGAA
jgi:hypothetical protein